MGGGEGNLPLGPQDKIDLLDLQKPFFTLDIFNQNSNPLSSSCSNSAPESHRLIAGTTLRFL